MTHKKILLLITQKYVKIKSEVCGFCAIHATNQNWKKKTVFEQISQSFSHMLLVRPKKKSLAWTFLVEVNMMFNEEKCRMGLEVGVSNMEWKRRG